MNMHFGKITWLVLCVFASLANYAQVAHAQQDTLDKLKSMSLEDLMSIEVTSVNRKKQRLADSAAAVFVISEEDIRRSGLQKLPEILRMAPGLQVAQIDSSKWAISSRGFNGRYSNKLLVLMDGRTIYSPLYSGVYWDVQDIVLEDIERIEVIRGPGATLWGANAVNGVINIISKSTRDTKSGLVSLASGNNENYSAVVRYGDEINFDTSYRIFAKGFERQGGEFYNDLTGSEKVHDEWKNRRIGFKLESALDQANDITVQGDWYKGNAEQNIYQATSRFSGKIVKDLAKTHGGNMMLHWKQKWSDDMDIALKVYYDHTYRKNKTIKEDKKTYDVDFQTNYRLLNQEIIWGLGYRHIVDDMEIPPGSVLSFYPKDRSNDLFSAFIQDDISFNHDSMHLVLGTKFENNAYTDNEWQPNIRFLWNIDQQSTFWTSISRAVRTPSRIERDVEIKTGGPVVVRGNDNFKSEKMIAYELGYRFFPSSNIAFDMTVFSNHYDQLLTLEAMRESSSLIGISFDNQMEAKTYGLELAVRWDINQNWRINGSYSWLQGDFKLEPGSSDSISLANVNNAPEHQFQLHSYYNLAHNVELDSAFYYVSRLPEIAVDSYSRFDLRLGWKASKNMEYSIAVQNVFDDKHPEFTEFSGLSFSGPQGLVSTQVERNFYVKLTWNF